MLSTERAEGDPGPSGAALRSDLLARLALLATVALVVGLGAVTVLQITSPGSSLSALLIFLLVLLDVGAFLTLGRRLVDRALNDLTDQLLQNQARLAENVRSLDETNRLLNDTQRELIQAEKMASIGRLGAGIAHEIGNPLGALLGYIGVLRRRDLAADLVPGMEREAGRIDQIVRGLLEYARPGPVTREPVDVNDSVRHAVELLRGQGRLAGVKVRLDLTEPLPRVEGSPHRLDQVFVNLLSNADAAMGEAGEIAVITRPERFTPERVAPERRADDPPGINYSHLRRLRYGTFRDTHRLQSEREVVRVVVADTGPGIPPEQIEAVFDPFFTTKPPGEGTGLGLAIVAGTVAEMGGRIELSSVPQGGATFNLFFPTCES